MIKKISMLALLSAFVVGLAACNTIEGAAKGGKKDIEETGQAIERAVD